MPLKKKEVKIDAEYYTNEIGVLEWLKNDQPQKIRFSNRWEYKVDNQLHREDGPAIEYFSGVGNQYMIHGEKYSKDEWTNYNRTKLIDRMNENNG